MAERSVAEQVHNKLRGRAVDVKCGDCGNEGEFRALAKLDGYDNVRVDEKVRISSGETYWESTEYFDIVCPKCDSPRVKGKKKLLEKLRNCEYEAM